MHIVQNYALSCGLKLSDTFIYDKIYPIPYDKYIVMSFANTSTNYRYGLWMDVIYLLKPILEKLNINLVILTNDDSQIDSIKTININKIQSSHLAYIIKNSLLHCGVDDFVLSLASHFNKKNIGIYNDISFFKNHGPISKDTKTLVDNLKSKLFPETIVKEIIAGLDLDDSILNYRTIHIGEFYSNNVMFECIPSQQVPQNIPNNVPIHVRFDYIDKIENLDLESTFNTLKTRACIFFTDKAFNISAFLPLKQNIHSIVYDVTSSIDIDFLNNALKITPNLKLIFYVDKNNESDLELRKFDLIDFPFFIHEVSKEKTNIDLKSVNNTKYKSSRLLFGNNQVFLSKTAWIEKKPAKNSIGVLEQEISEITDLDLFLTEDANFITLFAQNN